MKSAIRLAVILVMASASTAVLAEDLESTSGNPTAQEQSDATTTSNTDSQDVGHGSGEPARMTKAEDVAAEKAAIAEYNQQNYVNQEWAPLP